MKLVPKKVNGFCTRKSLITPVSRTKYTPYEVDPLAHPSFGCCNWSIDSEHMLPSQTSIPLVPSEGRSKSAAMDIIQQLDQTLYEMNLQIGQDYKAMEDAQQNAFLASQLIHTFSSSTNSSKDILRSPARIPIVHATTTTSTTLTLSPQPPLYPHRTTTANTTMTSSPSPMTMLRKTLTPVQKAGYGEMVPLTPPQKSVPPPPPPGSSLYATRPSPSTTRPEQSHRSPFLPGRITVPADGNGSTTVAPNGGPPRSTPSTAPQILQLTLELERVKQSLEQELMAHQQTQVALQHAERQNQQWQRRLQECQEQRDAEQAQHQRRCEEYEEELQRREERLLWVEQEAAAATDILFKADEERQRFEALYQQAQTELQQQLAAQQSTEAPPAKRVHFAKEHEERNKSPNRSLVAMGRHLWRQQSQQQSSHRERLRSASSPSKVEPDAAAAAAPSMSVDQAYRVRQLLQQSGERLQLWSPDALPEEPWTTLEQITRQYTTRVEVRETTFLGTRDYSVVS
jgi:chemotaxis protein histidine kinase CheA